MSNQSDHHQTLSLPYSKKLLIFWSVVLFWIMAFTATHLPIYSIRPSSSHLPFDKIAHFSIYACIAFGLLFIVWTRTTVSLKICLSVFLCLAMYGIVDELTQSFIPGRHADINDWYADCLGTFTGVACSLVAFRILSAINRKTPKVELNRS
ncbi:MAG: VanZ family protein [Pirellulales bacterium]